MIFQSTRLYRMMLMLIFLAAAGPIHATVEWRITNTLPTTAEPLDVVVHHDGQQIFVLTADGNVRIYDGQGQMTESIAVGSHIDHIAIGPEGDRLFAASRRNKTVEVIALTFVRSIKTEGAPFKGLPDAPVVVTVFSDFQ
jgi:DNA-binding beta-propeller fold protein YncE